MKASKPDTLRRLEVEGIRQRMTELDLWNMPEMSSFEKLLEEFEFEGRSASGRVRLPRLQRCLYYKLTTRPNVDSEAVLKYTGAAPRQQA